MDKANHHQIMLQYTSANCVHNSWDVLYVHQSVAIAVIIIKHSGFQIYGILVSPSLIGNTLPHGHDENQGSVM